MRNCRGLGAAMLVLFVFAGFILPGAASENRTHSLMFDGSNYVQLPRSSEILGDEPGALSVSLWVKFFDLDGAVYPAGGSYGRPFSIMLAREGSWLQVRLRGFGEDGEEVNDNLRHTRFNPELDSWYHICFTYSYETGRGSLYLNGREVASGNLGIAKPHHFPLRLGREQFYEGLRNQLDDARIYSRALEPAEVESLYRNEPVDETGLAGHWKLNEGERPRLIFESGLVHDSSGNEHHGRLGPEENMPEWMDDCAAGG